MTELFRTIIEIIPFSIILTSKEDNKMLYINSKTEEFFKSERSEMLGSEAENYYKHPADRQALTADVYNNIPVIEREVTFKRKDGTFFLGAITMVQAQYLEYEVLLSCINDITEKKQAEKKKKHDNEIIEKMNNELIKVNSILKNRAIRDGLTNLFNHQHINKVLEKEMLKVSKDNDDLCVLMLDIDLFKDVNDTFGHQIGDKVLIDVSNQILQNVRDSDYVGRYGGEEFIVVLPKIDIENAYILAERIRISIQNYDFEVPNLKVTISIGLAKCDFEDAKAVVNRADSLLYQAKRNGRNRVEIKLEEV